MSTRTVVHVLRHGEVDNPDKILYGRMPGYYLSELGIQMAKAAAEALAERDITYIVSSPLERAQQTAEPIAAQFGLPIATDDRLLEATNLFEGKKFAAGEGVLRHPRYWWWLRNFFRPSWGEPYKEVGARMLAALLAAREAAEGHEAVVISHQLPIETLRRCVRKETLWHDPRRRQCSLASLTSFGFAGVEITNIGYSEPAAHLVARSPGARSAKGA
ncbi:MAG: histidine phosphatase family protein [Micromonosporaceae bacterium]|nr:histidine phosphatase family protein [Micromonosporaceae bacterium]